MNTELTDLLLLWSLLITLVGINRILAKRRRRNRRWWVRPGNFVRREHGHNDRLYRYFQLRDQEEFFDTMRMWPDQFRLLLDLIEPYLRKQSFRKPLSTELRLAITLSYLAQGNSVKTLANDFYIGRSTTYKIIPEVCEALWKALTPAYLPHMTREKWAQVAKGFSDKTQFPNCIGAIDGKHVRIKAPCNSGSQFWCYKGNFSVVLMAACDADYRFTWVDIGQYGSISDGGVWSNSVFGQRVERGEVHFPPQKNLPGSNIPTHHAFVADEAFPLKLNILRPYSRNNLGDAERVFNYRLSRARRIIENVFGILVTRWQIFHKMIGLSPDSVTSVIKATVVLHNFLMTTNAERGHAYCPSGMVDRLTRNHEEAEGSWRRNAYRGFLADLTRAGGNNRGHNATHQRDTLRDYFVSEVGERQAPWQWEQAFRGMFINQPDSD